MWAVIPAPVGKSLALFAVSWILPFILSRCWLSLLDSTTTTPSATKTLPRHIRLFTVLMFCCADHFGTPSGADPGWCYLNHISSEFQPALTELRRLPFPTKVFASIEKLESTPLPCKLTTHYVVSHFHQAWGFTTALALLQTRQVAAPMIIGAVKVQNKNHLIVLCTLHNIKSQFLIESGATGSFCDSALAYAHGLTLILFEVHQEIKVIDGRTISSDEVTHTGSGTVDVFGHQEFMTFHIPALGGYDILRAISWLKVHDVRIDFKRYYVVFPPSCQDHVLSICPPSPRAIDSHINPSPTPLPPPPIIV